MMSCLWFEKLLPWNVHPCHLLGTSCARAAKRSSHTEDLHSINKDMQMVHSQKVSCTLYLQGVRRSWTVMSGLFLSGPETVKKCVAVWTWRDLGEIFETNLCFNTPTFLTGCISASRTTIEISAPLKYWLWPNIMANMVLSTCTPLFAGQAPWCPPPSACGGCSRGSTWTGQTWSVVDDIFLVLLRVITWRAPQAGQCRSSSQTWTVIFSNLKTILLYLLLMAASKCHGILVAPRTRIPSVSLPTPWNIWYKLRSICFTTKYSCCRHLHLYEELRLDSSRRLRLVVRTWSTQWVHLNCSWEYEENKQTKKWKY